MLSDSWRVARRKLGLNRLDRRGSVYKRACEIVAELERGLRGEITPLRRQAVERAALMTILAEDLSARRLQGEPIPLDEVLRAEGVARRAVRAITAERPAAAVQGRSLSALEWSEAK
jgi:hypothetical protein